MFARLRRIRHPWLVVIVVVALALVVIEAGQFFAAQSSVDRAAREAARYAVTGQFDPAHCADDNQCDSGKALPKEQREALEDAARLATIYDIGRAALSAEAAAAAHIGVCSSRVDETGRPKYTYDSSTGQCLPNDDPGGPGDKVMVDITTDYPVGSFLGSGVGSIPLHANQEMIVERYRTVRIQGLPPTVAASQSDAATSGKSQTANGSVGAQSSTAAIPEPATAQVDREQMIVMNGDLQLRVNEADQALTQVKSIALAAGGYLAKSEVWSEGTKRAARAELRIPGAQFQFVMEQLKGLATEVIHESATGEDVTEEYVDLDGRLKGLQATATRTEALLAKAEKVDEALKVNAELGRLQEQIEQITGRMEYLKNRVAYSTIIVALNPVVPPTPTPSPSPSAPVWLPGATVERAVGFWGIVVRFVVDVLIWIVMVGVPLALLVWFITRTLRRTRAQKKEA